MTMTTTTLSHLPRITSGPVARHAADDAYRLLDDVLARLRPEQWSAPTDCTGWTVQDMVAHLLGAARSHASVRELVRQLRFGERHKAAFDGNATDAVNDLQVREHAHLGPEQLRAALREVAPAAVRGRMRAARLAGFVPLRIPTAGSFRPGTPTRVSMAHLMNVVLTRDVWLHRFDIGRAAGLDVSIDGGLDRLVVADVAADWCGRHGRPVDLTLTGPAGLQASVATGGPVVTMDAVEFCRVLSGRADAPDGPGRELFATRVLF